jgi:hypothetical protein
MWPAMHRSGDHPARPPGWARLAAPTDRRTGAPAARCDRLRAKVAITRLVITGSAVAVV